MPKSDWWFKFEHLKWLTDEQLNRCSLETQGFWMRCICMMRKADSGRIEGTAGELARLLSVTTTEFKKCVSELNRTKTASVTQTAHLFTIMSRKFTKELKVREQNRLRKAKERRHAAVTDASQDRVKSKSKSKKEEEIRDASPAAPPRKKGTRLPDQFFLTSEMREYAAAKRPDVDPILETEKFCNHFRSAPGQKGVKLNWLLTWKNWILNAQGQRNGTNNRHQQQSKPTSTSRLEEYGSVIDQYPTEAELGNIA